MNKYTDKLPRVEQNRASRQYRITRAPHLLPKFHIYGINNELKENLWMALQETKLNKITGRHIVSVLVTDYKKVNNTLQFYKLLNKSGVGEDHTIVVAFDNYSYTKIKHLPHSIFNDVDYSGDINKIKATIYSQLLLWAAQVVILDEGIEPIQNLSTIFQSFPDITCTALINNEKPELVPGIISIVPTGFILNIMNIVLPNIYQSENIKYEITNFMNQHNKTLDTLDTASYSILYSNRIFSPSIKLLTPPFWVRDKGLANKNTYIIKN